jgi:MFS family permease
MSSVVDRFRQLASHPLAVSFYLPSLIFAISLGILKPITPLYASDFSSSYLLIGILLAGDPIGTLFADLPAGMLLRRLGDKRSMLVGLGIILTAAVFLFLAQSFVVALISMFAFGIGKALYGVSRHVYIADHVGVENRGRAIAVFGGMQRIGNAFGPAIGGFLAAGFGLRVPFLVFFGFVLLAVLVVIFFLKGNKRVEAHGQRFSVVTSLRTNSRVFATAGVGQIFAQMIRAGRDVVIPLYAKNVLGLSEETIGIIISLSWGLDMLMFYPAGWIMDRLGRKYAIVPSFMIQSAGMVLVALSLDFSGLLAASVLIGFGNGLGSGTMMTIGSDLAPPHERGEFLGMWHLIGDMGVVGAPLFIGWIAGLLALPVAAGALSSAGVLAALIFAYKVPETLKKR